MQGCVAVSATLHLCVCTQCGLKKGVLMLESVKMLSEANAVKERVRDWIR